MKADFVADVGDFAKYSLLRWLAGIDGDGPVLRLGVVWYLNGADRAAKSPNSRYDYLSPPHANRFAQWEPTVFAVMKRVVDSNARSVRAVEESEVLGPSTTYFTERVDVCRDVESRREWHRRALDATSHSDIVFLDPDNGLRDTDTVGPLYASYEEVASYPPTQTLVAYHHSDRSAKLPDQVTRQVAELKRHLGRDVRPVVFHPWSPRIFLIVLGRQREAVIGKRITSLISDRRWRTSVSPDGVNPQGRR